MATKKAAPPAPSKAAPTKRATRKKAAPAKRPSRKAAAPKLPDRRPVAPGDPGVPATGRWPRIADPLVVEAIIAGLQAGLPLPTAAARMRVPERTVQRWNARGLASIAACTDADEAGEPIPDADEPYHTFALGVIEARGAAEAAAVRVVVKHVMNDDFNAATWYLERVGAPRWANPSRVNVKLSGDPEAPLAITTGPPPDVFTVEQRLMEVVAALAEARVPVADDVRRIIDTTGTVAG